MRLQAQLRGVIYCRAQAAIIGGHLSDLAYTMATLWGKCTSGSKAVFALNAHAHTSFHR